MQCSTSGFANMKGNFWVRVYLVHLVLLVAVPVRSVTVCRVRTEPSSTCDAACVRAAVVRATAVLAAHRRRRARSAAASHSAQVRAAQKGRAKAHHSTCAISALWVPLHVPTVAGNVKFYLQLRYHEKVAKFERISHRFWQNKWEIFSNFFAFS